MFEQLKKEDGEINFRSMNSSQIIWKGNEIGVFEEKSMDMGYLDGVMTSNESIYAQQFVKLASELDYKTIMLNPKSGFRAYLKEETDFITHVLVMGITEKMELSLKMVVGKQEKIDWFIKNVPEERQLTTTYKKKGRNSAKTKDNNHNKLWSKLKSLWS